TPRLQQFNVEFVGSTLRGSERLSALGLTDKAGEWGLLTAPANRGWLSRVPPPKALAPAFLESAADVGFGFVSGLPLQEKGEK
ncbi:hypothetical protein E4U53_005273, partial [Claviceps sorghi]